MGERCMPAPIRTKDYCAVHLAGNTPDDPMVQKFIHYFAKAKELDLNYPCHLSFVLFSPHAISQGATVENYLGYQPIGKSLTELIDMIDRYEFLLEQPN